MEIIMEPATHFKELEVYKLMWKLLKN